MSPSPFLCMVGFSPLLFWKSFLMYFFFYLFNIFFIYEFSLLRLSCYIFYFLCMSAMSMFCCVSIFAQFSLSHASFACLHFFLISLLNILYSLWFLGIICCLFFISYTISPTICFFIFVSFPLRWPLLLMSQVLPLRWFFNLSY